MQLQGMEAAVSIAPSPLYLGKEEEFKAYCKFYFKETHKNKATVFSAFSDSFQSASPDGHLEAADDLSKTENSK